MTAIELNDVSNPYRALTVSDDVSLTLKKNVHLALLNSFGRLKISPRRL